MYCGWYKAERHNHRNDAAQLKKQSTKIMAVCSIYTACDKNRIEVVAVLCICSRYSSKKLWVRHKQQLIQFKAQGKSGGRAVKGTYYRPSSSKQLKP